MGYRKMDINLLFEIYRRCNGGWSKQRMVDSFGIDRKTLVKYLRAFESLAVEGESTPQAIRQALEGIVPKNEKPAPAFRALKPYEAEIRSLIGDHDNPVKPKTAWLVICERHALSEQTSYETFKRFVRERDLARLETKSPLRIELEPGEETQIDYGKVGTLHDATSGRKRTVYAFCGILSASRLPFVMFVHTQDSPSFIESLVTMAGFYGGVTLRLNLDNLKAGVLKANVIDPVLNRAFADFCEYYGVFADPSRVRRPTDKGKVERMVPQARELFGRLVALHPHADLVELNELASDWCTEEYGRKPHGTTGIPPMEAFTTLEKPRLKALPARRFEVPIWTLAVVHPDQFIKVRGKLYGLPSSYRGRQVAVRIAAGGVRIFFQEKLIREYRIPGGYRAYLDADFPEATRAAMNGSYGAYLIRTTAADLGEPSARLIEMILVPHANLNARRALSVIDLMKRYRSLPLYNDVIAKALTSRTLSRRALEIIFEDEKRQRCFQFVAPQSESGRQMTRDVSYYVN